jgi:hypothetical protein
MSLLKKTRGAQWPLYAEFTFNVGDTIVDVAGVTKAFGAVAPVADIISLPLGAVILSGFVLISTASNDSSTATIAVGDSTTANRYLAATTIKTAADVPLVPTGFRGAGQDLRVTLANAGGDATAGTVTIGILYIINNRVNEVQST